VEGGPHFAVHVDVASFHQLLVPKPVGINLGLVDLEVLVVSADAKNAVSSAAVLPNISIDIHSNVFGNFAAVQR
jgi:hypothetical protein